MSSNIYHQYTTNNVFADTKMNVVCNQLIHGLTQAGFELAGNFGLSGLAALHYQNGTNGPIQRIEFTAKDSDIFFFLAKDFGKLCPSLSNQINFKSKILGQFDDTYIEIHMNDDIGKTIYYNNILIIL